MESIKGIEIPFKSVDKGVCPLFFPIIVRDRDMVESYLRKNNIEAYVFGRNLHRSLIREDYLESRFLSNHVLGIPIHQDLQKEDMKVIAKAVASSVEIQEKM